MAKWWRIGAIVLAGVWLPADAQAQFSLFGKKTSAPQQDPPAAFSTPAQQPPPDFCPDPRSLQPGAPDFCPAPNDGPQTPFLPCNEEDRTAFCDYKTAEVPPLIFWVKSEYLNWQFRNQNLNTYLATTSATPSLVDNFGALGQSGTQTLFGPQSLNLDHVQGGRVTAGFSLGFLPPIEVSGFWLNHNTGLFSASSDGGPTSPVLARPVFATQPGGGETVFLAGFPGVVSGRIDISSTTNLWGTDSNMFFNLGSSDVLFVDFFLGYRYAELRESLNIFNSASPLTSAIPLPFNGIPGGFGPGNTTTVYDSFGTVNRFNGGQIGLRTGLNWWRFMFMTDAKLAIGATGQHLSTQGTSSLSGPLAPYLGTLVQPGGILAVNSNSGYQSASAFTIIPELDLNVGFQVNRSVRLFAGYTLFWWSSVVRPDNQINNSVDTRQAPTDLHYLPGFVGSQPTSPFNRTDFFAHGFNVGVLIGF